MTRPVDPVGPLASVDRRKVERRDGQRRAPDASRSAVTPSSTPDADDVLSDGRAQAPVPPSPSGVDAAAVPLFATVPVPWVSTYSDSGFDTPIA